MGSVVAFGVLRIRVRRQVVMFCRAALTTRKWAGGYRHFRGVLMLMGWMSKHPFGVSAPVPSLRISLEGGLLKHTRYGYTLGVLR